MTVADAARLLEVSRWGVHWLVAQHRLRCEWTRAGQRLFRQGAVETLALARAQARLERPRRVVLPKPQLHLPLRATAMAKASLYRCGVKGAPIGREARKVG